MTKDKMNHGGQKWILKVQYSHNPDEKVQYWKSTKEGIILLHGT